MKYPDCPACKQGLSWDGHTQHVEGCPERAPDGMKFDIYGCAWGVSIETCPECGQPDNCGDCTHEPLTLAQVVRLGGFPSESEEE